MRFWAFCLSAEEYRFPDADPPVVKASVPISLVGLDKRGRLHFRAGHGDPMDITATDQIKPIATTTAIPIPVRICSPSPCLSLEIGLTYIPAPPCEAMHSRSKLAAEASYSHSMGELSIDRRLALPPTIAPPIRLIASTKSLVKSAASLPAPQCVSLGTHERAKAPVERAKATAIVRPWLGSRLRAPVCKRRRSAACP